MGLAPPQALLGLGAGLAVFALIVAATGLVERIVKPAAAIIADLAWVLVSVAVLAADRPPRQAPGSWR